MDLLSGRESKKRTAFDLLFVLSTPARGRGQPLGIRGNELDPGQVKLNAVRHVLG